MVAKHIDFLDFVEVSDVGGVSKNVAPLLHKKFVFSREKNLQHDRIISLVRSHCSAGS
jgi:hypothetical protein